MSNNHKFNKEIEDLLSTLNEAPVTLPDAPVKPAPAPTKPSQPTPKPRRPGQPNPGLRPQPRAMDNSKNKYIEAVLKTRGK